LGEGAKGQRALTPSPTPPPPNPYGDYYTEKVGAHGPAFPGHSAGWQGGVGGGQGPQVPGPSPTSQLILLAAVHGDPAGYERAWQFFECLRPEVITVEISRFSVRYRQRQVKNWRRQLAQALLALPPEAARDLAVARVAAQAEVPFEYRAARDWGNLHKIPVKFLDSGKLARRHLPRYARELLTADNLRSLCAAGHTGTLETFVAGEFRRARLAREGKFRLSPRLADADDSARERLLARRLQVLMAAGKRVVHLGGWEHLIPWPGGGSLVQLLGSLKPAIALLDEADEI
jgi:hypothetical protein